MRDYYKISNLLSEQTPWIIFLVSKLLKENVSSSLKKATLIENVFEKSFIASASEGETLKISQLTLI